MLKNGKKWSSQHFKNLKIVSNEKPLISITLTNDLISSKSLKIYSPFICLPQVFSTISFIQKTMVQLVYFLMGSSISFIYYKRLFQL